ncbi:MAG: hypothetical protein BWY78_00093 [Alphaproteobacteria bacterium ADurb.Bin438]|nr:MAG: hypothetical protein BWY78_00093 [Alphaproteobacteria bacterium ADurb.Bin438]
MSRLKKTFKIIFVFLNISILSVLIGLGFFVYKVSNDSVSLNIISRNILSFIKVKNLNLKISDSSISFLKDRKYPIQIVVSDVSFKYMDSNEGFIETLVLNYSWKSLLKRDFIPNIAILNGVNVKRFKQDFEDIETDFDILYQAKMFFSFKDFEIEDIKIINATYEYYGEGDKLIFKASSDETSFSKLGKDVFEFKNNLNLEDNGINVAVTTETLYNVKDSGALVKIRFKNVNLSDIDTSFTSFIEPLKNLNSLTHGEALIRLKYLNDKNKKIFEHVDNLSFRIFGKKGEFKLGDNIFVFDDIVLNLRSNETINEILIEKSEVNYKNAKANVDGKITGVLDYLNTDNYENLKMYFHAVAKDLPFDKLTDYWPSFVGPETWLWVKNHMSGGIITSGDFELLYKGVNNSSVFAPERIDGIAKVKGVKVDYLEGMPPVDNADGSIHVSLDKVDIFIDKGNTFNLDFKKGVINFYDIDKVETKANLKFDLKGSLKDALLIADSKPLEFIKLMGIDANKSDGNSDFNLLLHFPVRESLTIKDVKVYIQGVAENFGLSVNDTVKVSKGKINFNIDNQKAEIKGDVEINDASSKLVSVIKFDETRDFYQKHLIDIWLDEDDLKNMFKSEAISNFVKGLVKVNVDIVYKDEKNGKINLLFDLADVSFDASIIGIKKELGKKADLILVGNFNDQGLVGEYEFAYKSTSSLITGKMFFEKGSRLKKIDFSQIKSPKNDIKAVISFDKDYNPDIKISGKEFNLTHLLSGKNDASLNYFKIKLEASKVWVSNHGFLSQFYFYANKVGGVLKNLDFSSVTNEKHNPSDVSLKIENNKVTGKANNLGDVLKAFTPNPELRLGVASIDGTINKFGNVKGKIKVKDFVIKDAPIIGKILLTASITGVVNALSPGIEFDKANFPFEYKNNVLEIKEGVISNTSLGFTLNGKYDRKTDEVALKGSVIPIYWANGLLGKVPLIGGIFAGEKGGGVFGINYEVNGKYHDVKVSSNPLSVFTPGILRTMIKNADEKN